jgi:hypothetical protein
MEFAFWEGNSREISLRNRENLPVESETFTREAERDAFLSATKERERESFEMSHSRSKDQRPDQYFRGSVRREEHWHRFPDAERMEGYRC